MEQIKFNLKSLKHVPDLDDDYQGNQYEEMLSSAIFQDCMTICLPIIANCHTIDDFELEKFFGCNDDEDEDDEDSEEDDAKLIEVFENKVDDEDDYSNSEKIEMTKDELLKKLTESYLITNPNESIKELNINQWFRKNHFILKRDEDNEHTDKNNSPQ